MLKFLRSWQFAVIVFVVIAALAIAGTIYGIVTHTEPGFDPQMLFIAERVDRGHDSVPIDACVSSYTAEHEDGRSAPASGDLDAVRAAGVAINQRVGFELLNIGPIARVGDIMPVRCVILVNVGVPQDVERDEGGGWAYRCQDSCCIDISNTGTSELTHLVIQHELGHCLGLAHDPFASSIMRDPEQFPIAPTSDGQFPPRITDFDRELLRGRYMRP